MVGFAAARGQPNSNQRKKFLSLVGCSRAKKMQPNLPAPQPGSGQVALGGDFQYTPVHPSPGGGGRGQCAASAGPGCVAAGHGGGVPAGDGLATANGGRCPPVFFPSGFFWQVNSIFSENMCNAVHVYTMDNQSHEFFFEPTYLPPCLKHTVSSTRPPCPRHFSGPYLAFSLMCNAF